MEIRRANAGDIGGILELLVQVCNVHAAGRPDLFQAGKTKYTGEELISMVESERDPIFAAVEGDLLLGYCFCIHQEHDGRGVMAASKTLYIDDLCVREGCRGKKVGQALYEHVKGYAKERGYYNITLNVWGKNEGARGFYEKMGMGVQKIGMEEIIR